LRVANRFLGAAFTWRFVSVDGAAVAASNGIPVSVSGRLADVGRPNLAVVCASYDHEKAMTKPMLAGIRALARKGVWLGGLDTGAILLAEAGVLDGCRATCHWETLPAMRESYPRVEVTDRLYEIDRARLTSSGGTVPLDMMLEWIGSLHGSALAARVQDTLVHWRQAPGGGAGEPAARASRRTDDERLKSVVAAMDQHIEDVLRIGDLARLARLSPRQLERRFRSAFGLAPMAFYLRVRLERAEHLLTYGHMSVREVALATGFSSLSRFSRAYKARYGLPPSRHRRGAKAA
jgi:AraC family carnitine catabolism transcriptional activator